MIHLKCTLLILAILTSKSLTAQNMDKEINKHGMQVSWSFEADQLMIVMSAPTTGWVTVGFNENPSTDGAYLLMGNIIHSKITVTEHYTLSPGNYKPFSQLGAAENISIISGKESSTQTTITFKIVFDERNKYQEQLQEGKSLYMIMAYSRADDFQHHSMWRESVKITL